MGVHAPDEGRMEAGGEGGGIGLYCSAFESVCERELPTAKLGASVGIGS